MIIVELDKAGAEWVIVAHITNDASMLAVVESGDSPHPKTGHLISGVPEELILKEHKIVGDNTNPDLIRELREGIPELMDFIRENHCYTPRSMSIRQAGKVSNHGLNYGMGYSRFALENEIMENEAKELVELYHAAYPGVRLWHKAVQAKLRKDRTLINCFGRKRKFLGGWGPELFDAAYSFVPQSTTYDCIREGMHKTYWDDSKIFRPIQIIIEVHDSFGFLYPERPKDLARVVIKIGLDYMSPTLQYGSKEFKIGTTAKIGYNLGEMEAIKVTKDPKEVEESIKEAMDRLNGKKAR